MALRNRIINFRPVATATTAKVATLEVNSQRPVAKVATVAVADEEKKGNQAEEYCPAVCSGCNWHETVEIMGKPVAGCLYAAPEPYSNGWKRLPADLQKCLYEKEGNKIGKKSPENTGRDQDGRFKPGSSGNPAGTLPGTCHKASIAAMAITGGRSRKADEKSSRVKQGEPLLTSSI